MIFHILPTPYRQYFPVTFCGILIEFYVKRENVTYCKPYISLANSNHIKEFKIKFVLETKMSLGTHLNIEDRKLQALSDYVVCLINHFALLPLLLLLCMWPNTLLHHFWVGNWMFIHTQHVQIKFSLKLLLLFLPKLYLSFTHMCDSCSIFISAAKNPCPSLLKRKSIKTL